MRPMRMIGMTGVLLAGAMIGCSGNVQTENTLLREENEELRAQYKESADALDAADQDLRRAHDDLRNANEQLTTFGDDASGSTTGSAFAGIDGVEVDVRDQELTLTVASDLLFSSGSANVRRSAKSTLAQVASALQAQYPGRAIRIQGYTDSDPIKKSGHKSNWHLAFDRAWAVRDELVAKGIGKDRITLESYGPTRPRATKEASRRVEIVVVTD